MAQPSDELLLTMWHRALEVEIGVAYTVTSGERPWFVKALYRVRQDAGDERLDDIMLFQPPKEDEIFLCRKQTNL